MTRSVRPKGMVLSFPNLSRSFDATRSGARFWDYDSAIEISFFVEANALEKLRPELSAAEAEILEAFDAVRERIHEVADESLCAEPQRFLCPRSGSGRLLNGSGIAESIHGRYVPPPRWLRRREFEHFVIDRL